MTCLRALFPHLAEAGILIADGYADWDGYAKAIQEYLVSYETVARISTTQAPSLRRQGTEKMGVWDFRLSGRVQVTTFM